MQSPDGHLLRGELDALEEKRDALEAETGKPHPIFHEGKIVEIEGGKWRVTKIMSRDRMVLKAHPY